MSGLHEDLRAELGEIETLDWTFFPDPEAAIEDIAAAVLDWLRARLGSDEVREVVARSIHGNTIGDPAKGEPLVRVDRRTDDIVRDADAALGAVLAALEVEGAQKPEKGDGL